MSINEDMPLLSEQELRTHNVRIYRPHTTTKKPAFDWDALTPSCRGCGTKTGTLNRDDLCRSCAPVPTVEEKPRDDRAGHSGSTPKEYDPEICLAVERLYVQERLSQGQVAERLGLTRKVVATIMHRRGVRARQGETGHIDGAVQLRAQIERLNVLPRTIKLWALQTGRVDRMTPGYPSQALVDAYEAAHGEGRS